MLLSDRDIHHAMHPLGGRSESASHRLVVDGMAEGAIGPASIDLMLSNHFHFFYEEGIKDHIDPQQDQTQVGRPVEVEDGDYFRLAPGMFCLASTRERFVFPRHLAGRLEGKSSLGRLGLMVHVCAGFFDPGFEGYPTLELVNVRQRPMRLYPGMPVAQMSIFQMVSPSARAYSGKYTDQGAAPAPSQFHLNFKEHTDAEHV